jgi:hypothetical protein
MKIKRLHDAHAGQLAEKDLEILNYKKLDAERLASEHHSNQVLKAYDKKFSDFVGQLDGAMKMMGVLNQQKVTPSPRARIQQSPIKSPIKPDARAEHLKTIQPVIAKQNGKQKTQNYLEGGFAEQQVFSKLFDNVQLEVTQAMALPYGDFDESEMPETRERGETGFTDIAGIQNLLMGVRDSAQNCIESNYDEPMNMADYDFTRHNSFNKPEERPNFGKKGGPGNTRSEWSNSPGNGEKFANTNVAVAKPGMGDSSGRDELDYLSKFPSEIVSKKVSTLGGPNGRGCISYVDKSNANGGSTEDESYAQFG